MTNKYLEKIAAKIRSVNPKNEDYKKHAPKSTKAATGLLATSIPLNIGSIVAHVKGKSKLGTGLLGAGVGTYAAGVGTAMYAGKKTHEAVNKKYKIVKNDK